MNDNGDIVVGYVSDRDDSPLQLASAAVWRDRKLTHLPAIEGERGNAWNVNAAGDIVGSSFVSSVEGAPFHATLWRDDEPQDLGTLGGENSLAYGINDSGLVVGFSELPGSDAKFPCLWREGEIEQLPLPDGMTGFAADVNASEAIVGTVFDAVGNYYAAHWMNGEVELLPGLFEGAIGSAGDVNSDGVIVGVTAGGTDPGAPLAGAIWVEGRLTILQDLIPADSGYQIGSVADINDAGQIVASATTPDGVRHGVILSPFDGTSASVSQAERKSIRTADRRILSLNVIA